METAYLRFTVKTNPLGIRESLTAEWDGKSPYTYISWRFLGDIVGIGGETNEIQIGPYKLLRIEHDELSEKVLYVRKDKLGALRVALYKSTRLLDLIYRRLIVTLAVWRLAEFSIAVLPSWRDIKALKGFTKK